MYTSHPQIMIYILYISLLVLRVICVDHDWLYQWFYKYVNRAIIHIITLFKCSSSVRCHQRRRSTIWVYLGYNSSRWILDMDITGVPKQIVGPIYVTNDFDGIFADICLCWMIRLYFMKIVNVICIRFRIIWYIKLFHKVSMRFSIFKHFYVIDIDS